MTLVPLAVVAPTETPNSTSNRGTRLVPLFHYPLSVAGRHFSKGENTHFPDPPRCRANISHDELNWA